jgi:hypothetical protein
MRVVRKEEKEAKLRDFVRQHMQRLAAANARGVCYLLVARSVESPIAKALAFLAEDMAAAGISVAVVLAKADGGPLSTEMPSIRALASAGCSLLADPRLLDAHELLVLGPKTAWIGDCMRREPAKRDAYECYSYDSGEVAGWARHSFDRLWQAAEALDMKEADVPVEADYAPCEASLPGASASEPAPAEPRH